MDNSAEFCVCATDWTTINMTLLYISAVIVCLKYYIQMSVRSEYSTMRKLMDDWHDWVIVEYKKYSMPSLL